MDTAYLKNNFKQEIDELSKIKSSRKRRYSAEFKRAILKVHKNGVSLDKIRRDLGLGGGAFKCWLAESRPSQRKKNKAKFSEINVLPVAQARPIVPAVGPTQCQQIAIEIPMGITIRIHHYCNMDANTLL